MDHLLKYSNLKRGVLEEAGSSFSLEQLKEHFSTPINSRRALSRVKSLACIIHLLEERDVLNWRNVECLKQLDDLLLNNKIGELVQSYKKLFLEDIEEKLCICGVQTTFQPDSSPMSQRQENQCLTQNNNHVIPDLIEALRNISQRIGKEWPYLARELGIRECHMDRIRNEYPNNFESQAKEALYLWLRREQENASVEILDRALNARHCQRRGIGSFMRRRM
ncbi:hypothetical protein AVEN_67056-1 [Araneus ventricosus]|uniref:Death domain-containing protein n=1 Tax=Araneus ventricosus TaxID=182803 RepID=A0A4Y2KCC4_ARAVE|nr:hypothetical protein AVEN_67056-1 [Araneus ventricosus]